MQVDLRQHGGIVGSPVVLEGQPQIFCYDIQFVPLQVGQQHPRHFHGIDAAKFFFDAELFASRPQEGDVKISVVGAQGPIPHKIEKGLHRLLLAGGIPHHIIGDAGEFGDLIGHRPRGLHIGVKAFFLLAARYQDGGDLNDLTSAGAQACGLQIKYDGLAIQRSLAGTADRLALGQVVDTVGFDPVDHFDLCPFALELLLGVHRVGEGLDHPMVGNGHCLVPPPGRRLDQIPGGRQAIHGGHAGM